MSPALTLLASERPRNVSWFQAGALLFGDWGTSRLYVLGLAFLVAGRSSFWLISAMSVLILVVGWAYTHICRLYPDGGGVYTAARQRSKLLGVVGALLLFADYTITASLSSLEAFHYFGLGDSRAAHVQEEDAGSDIRLHEQREQEELIQTQTGGVVVTGNWTLHSPALWAVAGIIALGMLNLLGPRHTADFALLAAAGMVLITLLVVVFALPQIDWANIDLGHSYHAPLDMWQAFVAIVLALSGVEAIANLTGVMRRPVHHTARKSIWVVAGEVALFNILLAAAMVAIEPLGREAHKEDMLAFMAGHYIGAWGEWPVRIIGGVLLLSATNTAIGALMGTIYVMSRDRELPAVLQKLNGFGAPWIGAVIAASVPAVVLVFVNDLESLAHLYAIGIVGAVAISCTVSAFHGRLRRWWRRGPMIAVGLLLVAIWITLALTKLHAVLFVGIILVIGLGARQLTRWAAARRPRPSLLRQAIMDQLPADVWTRPKVLLATAGSDELAVAALAEAQREEASLVVAFIRDVALNMRAQPDRLLTLDTDPAAQQLFVSFLEHGYRVGVPIIPVYDTGNDPSVLIAEAAAVSGVSRVLIGSSRRGTLHHLIRGSFQRRLESLLPPEIRVEVISRSDADSQSSKGLRPANGSHGRKDQP